MIENPTVEYSRKATLAKLLALKERRRKETRTVYVPGLGTTLELQRLPLAEYLDLDTRLTEASNNSPEFIRALDEKIYAFCTDFHAQEVQEGYAPKIPSDIVGMILLDDFGDRLVISEAINEMYGLGKDDKKDDKKDEKPQETIKN